jgi:L-ascorbate metabolism protein UlaG (beta-lactamase superfamily)
MEWSKATVPAGPPPLCVFSHAHEDHFDAGQVREFCDAVLGPKDVVAAAGVPALKLEPEVRWKGITLRPLATPHGPVEHYSFVLEWSVRRLYFSGDTEDPATLLAQRDLDAAFVSPWLLEAASKRRRIDARRVVVYHHTAGEAVPEVQQRILPKPGQVLSLGSDGHRVEE